MMIACYRLEMKCWNPDTYVLTFVSSGLYVGCINVSINFSTYGPHLFCRREI